MHLLLFGGHCLSPCLQQYCVPRHGVCMQTFGTQTAATFLYPHRAMRILYTKQQHTLGDPSLGPRVRVTNALSLGENWEIQHSLMSFTWQH